MACSGESRTSIVDTNAIPALYNDLADVFSKDRAVQLLPHQAYDLIPGTTFSWGHLYFLSIPEQKAMEKYVAEGLQQRTLQPSSSPGITGSTDQPQPGTVGSLFRAI